MYVFIFFKILFFQFTFIPIKILNYNFEVSKFTISQLGAQTGILQFNGFNWLQVCNSISLKRKKEIYTYMI